MLPELPTAILDALLAARYRSKDPAAAVEALCGQHPDFTAAIRAHAAADTPASQPVVLPMAPRGSTSRVTGPPAPTQIGPYRILNTLGEGGMGTVYLAEQSVPVKRKVALKLIKLGMDSKAVVARFEQERQALALMAHDGIAKVYDCGMSGRGQPFFVMELVKGVPLTAFCEQHRLSLPDRLLLMRQVCAAVQHAHQKGVVHRDLKPSNVLVSDDSGKPLVKIIDFGLAKSMGQKLAEATLFTEVGQVIGTPEYMAPEQADLTNADIDTRVDIYSLGVMLYEVLVGSLPFSGAGIRKMGLQQVKGILREMEPPRPSTKLSTAGHSSTAIAGARRMTVVALWRALKNELDWVVLKAIEKDRNRRYETASALASDLQRFLDHEPLVAGPPSSGYRLRLFARKHRGILLSGCAVLLALILGGIGTFVQHLRAEETVREFNLLACNVHYERALASEATLYPPWPSKQKAMEQWLEQEAGSLLAMKAGIVQAVRDLEARALQVKGPEQATDPNAARQSRGFRFELESQQFLHDTLAVLVANLSAFEAKQMADVKQRLAWANQVQGLSLAHPNARHTWASVREAIAANERYAGQKIQLRDQDITGLVPIGENPVTKLWEFYELRSAWDGVADPSAIAIPAHGPKGSIKVTDNTGIVFVLLPGGTFLMGAQKQAKDKPNFDRDARDNETPNQVTLAPFFLARHEMTRGQWQRLTGAPPRWLDEDLRADGDEGTLGGTHPAESVSWEESNRCMEQHGLCLPTEAQWEYGCRGGVAAPWWTGGEAITLDGAANLLDQAAIRRHPEWGIAELFDDHFTFTAPVGSFRQNGFGLYDVLGNVSEWCRDVFHGYDVPWRADDGLRGMGSLGYARVRRGGSLQTPALTARSAFRGRLPPSVTIFTLGLRPARSTHPEIK